MWSSVPEELSRTIYSKRMCAKSCETVAWQSCIDQYRKCWRGDSLCSRKICEELILTRRMPRRFGLTVGMAEDLDLFAIAFACLWFGIGWVITGQIPAWLAWGFVLLGAWLMYRVWTAEFVGHNVRPTVKQLQEQGESNEAIQATASEYDETHDLDSVDQSREMSDLERMCRAIATAHVNRAIKASGLTVKEVKQASPEGYEQLIAETAMNETVRKAAELRLK